MTAAIELDLLLAWLNRPGATPAPTAGEQPKPTTDQPIPSRPGPCVTEQPSSPNLVRIAELTADTDEVIAGARAVVADVYATIARHRKQAA